jgi:outer membrane lipoprotein carrier protein
MKKYLLLLLLCSFPAFASGLDDFLAFNSSSKTASGRFDQQVFDRGGKAVEKASGTFTFQRPGKFRWTYEKPHKQLLVGDGSKLWIHDPDLNQVTVKRIDQAISSTPAALLAGKNDITTLFTLRDAGAADGLNWVEATPKAQDTGFEGAPGTPGQDARGDGAIRLVGWPYAAQVLGPEIQCAGLRRHLQVQPAQGRGCAGGRAREEVIPGLSPDDDG